MPLVFKSALVVRQAILPFAFIDLNLFAVGFIPGVGQVPPQLLAQLGIQVPMAPAPALVAQPQQPAAAPMSQLPSAILSPLSLIPLCAVEPRSNRVVSGLLMSY